MAYTDVKTIAADLRVTDKDKGSFLTVDDNCNVVWTNSRITASGGVWEYNIVDDDAYIILPSAKLNIGLCVAIMRGKAPYSRDLVEGSGSAGVDASKANPKVVILPYNAGTAEEPNYDYIMGDTNFYCSSGISWTESINDFAITNMEWDDFSSVIFKSVYSGDGKYSWTIINGVGLWNAEKLDTHGYIYKAAINKAKNEFKVSLQTAAVNSLSASINTTDTEFSPIETISGNGLIAKQFQDSTESVQILPQNTLQNAEGEFVKGTSFIIGRFTDDTSGKFNALYSEFPNAAVNIFGPKTGSWEASDSLNVNQIDNGINYLGYIYDDTTENTWWQNLGNKSFTKRLGLRQKGTISTDFDKTVGAAQIIVNIDLTKIRLKNQKTISSVRNLYCLLQSFFEISSNYIMPYTNVFKVRGDVYSADNITIGDNDIVSLTSAGLGETNSDSGFGSLVQIPITPEDITVGSINLVFEFLYRPFEIKTTPQLDFNSKGQCLKLHEAPNGFELLNNKSNQYCLINFVGVEQLKSTSISPEVSFEQVGIVRLADKGEINEAEGHDEIGDAYLDYNATSSVDYKDSENFIGIVLPDGSYGEIGYHETHKSFFDAAKRFHPADNVTKTVIEYDTGVSECTNEQGAIKARLVIDWTDRTWLFNGVLKHNGVEYLASVNQPFKDTPYSIDFCQKGTSGEIKLAYAIHIQYDGLYRLPWFVSGSTDGQLEASINITNYKTIVHESGLVETLMNYRCGWERAEKEWTVGAYIDGSEYDALISNYSNMTEGGKSPSKLCIKPSHAMQLTHIGSITFSRSESIDKPDTEPRRSLLPYLTNDDQNKELRYFSTNWKRRQLSLSSNSDLTDSNQNPLVANDFCELTFNPKSTGTLFCNIELPIDTGVSSTGYLVVREIQNEVTEDGDTFGDYTLVKDSGSSINSTQTAGYSTLKIDFTDNVIANKIYRYTLIIYDAPWTPSTVIDNTRNVIYKPNNTAIVRYRPSDSLNGIIASGVNDFKGLFDTELRGPYSIPSSSAGRNIYSVFNHNESEVSDNNINDGIDRSANFNIEKFKKSLFKTSETNKSFINGTLEKNLGATFTFHAYVIKETF